MDFNKIFISGKITRDVEYYQTLNNQSILKFNIEVIDRKVHNFFNVVIFGQLAEASKKILKKNEKVFIEGRLRYSKYKTKTGAIKSNIEIIADKIFLLNEGGFINGKPKSATN